MTWPNQRPVLERFWERVDFSDPLSCWEWKGHRVAGYGKFVDRGKYIAAHRYSYELHRGPIPAGLQIDHLCRNRACIRPDHLDVVTRQENARRAAKANSNKTRCKYGHPFSGTNLRIDSLGRRVCRTCVARRSRIRYHALKSEART